MVVAVDLGFHLALSYRDLKHPTSRQNFVNSVGQNHALILTQCHYDTVICGINIFGPSEQHYVYVYLLVTTINVLPSSGSTKHVVNLFQFGVAPVWG